MIIVSGLDFAAQHDAHGFEPHVAADLGGNHGIVAGKNFHCDAVLAQQPQRFGSRLFRRIEERDETRKNQPAFVGVGKAAPGSTAR